MSKKCLNGFEMSKVESLIVEFFNNADAVQVEEGAWYYSESSVNSELLEVYTQLEKANERVKELEKNSKDSFVSFAKNHNTVDGPTALFIHALGVAFDKEQLRKEQEQC